MANDETKNMSEEFGRVTDEIILAERIYSERMRAVSRAAAYCVLHQYMPVLEAAKSERATAEYASLHDSLTGLANTRAYLFAMKPALDMAYFTASPVSIVWLYFDSLKEINDTQGHDAGDRAIITAADILRRQQPQAPEARDHFCPSRFEAGDEFGVTLLGSDKQAASDWWQQADSEFTASGIIMRTAVVSCGPEYPMTTSDLYLRAGAALLRARQTGLIEYYDPTIPATG